MKSIPRSTASDNLDGKHNPTAVGIGLGRESSKIHLRIGNAKGRPEGSITANPPPHPDLATPNTPAFMLASNRGH